MRKHRIGTLVVIGGNRPVGMLNEHDIVHGVIALGTDPREVLVSEIMTAAPTIGIYTTMGEAIAIAASTDSRQLLVVSGESLKGLVSCKDLDHWTIAEQALQISDLTAYITGRAGGIDRLAETVIAQTHGTKPHRDEPDEEALDCAYCGERDPEANWDMGVAVCRACFASQGGKLSQ
jgi:hypothetical protein